MQTDDRPHHWGRGDRKAEPIFDPYFHTPLMVRILSLGQLSLVGNDGQPVANAAAQPRRLALLAVLGRSAPKAVSREKLIAWFWPDADEERGRRSLNQALYALRSELGSEDVLIGQRDLRLNLDLVSSDAADFETAMESGRFEEAASLYRGPFLDGFHLSSAPEFEQWVEDERRAMAHRYAEALETLATTLERKNDHAGRGDLVAARCQRRSVECEGRDQADARARGQRRPLGRDPARDDLLDDRGAAVRDAGGWRGDGAGGGASVSRESRVASREKLVASEPPATRELPASSCQQRRTSRDPRLPTRDSSAASHVVEVRRRRWNSAPRGDRRGTAVTVRQSVSPSFRLRSAHRRGPPAPERDRRFHVQPGRRDGHRLGHPVPGPDRTRPRARHAIAAHRNR